MTATATAEIRRRLRDAEGLLTSAAGQLAGWEDPAASRIRPDVDEVAPNLGVISRHAADLDERVDAAIRLMGAASANCQSATAAIAQASALHEGIDRQLTEAEQALRRGEQSVRESSHLVTRALQIVSQAGSPGGLAVSIDALEGELATRVRGIRVARAKRMIAVSAARAVATEAAWMTAEHLAGAAVQATTGLKNVQFGDAWDSLRASAEVVAPLTVARIRALLDQLRAE